MVKVIAHRGASKLAPQNTLSAFRLAKELKADGFENDVHMTKDGHIVVCHDYDIDETSNGTGHIIDYTLEELLKFDFGSYFSPEFEGEKIPTLNEFFEISKGLSIINVEIKRPFDGNFEIVDGVIESAKSYGVFPELLISSFDESVLHRAKKVDGNVKAALLYDPLSLNIDKIVEDPVAYALDSGFEAIHPVFLMVDEDLVEDARKNNIEINVWTINNERAAKVMTEWGVDGLITDDTILCKNVINGIV